MRFISPYLIFSAPSGGGKTTIVKKLVATYDDLVISVSATTRPRRPHEVDGRDYHFLSREAFERKIKENAFLEYERVHNFYYGTLKDTVEHWIARDKIVLFDIDVNGARSIKEARREAVSFFIKPPSEEELVRRLRQRKSENDEAIRLRLQRIRYEYEQAIHFDHIIVNDQLCDTLRKIEEIIILES